MKVVNLLLAVSDRRVGNSIEAAVRDACYEQAVVECVRCSRLDEFMRHGRAGWLDLIVVAPNSVLPTSNRRAAQVSREQIADAVRGIKSQGSVPLLAVNVSPEDELPLLEAGVDATFGFPVDTEALKHEVRRALRLSEPVRALDANAAGSLAGLFLRGWQLLTNA